MTVPRSRGQPRTLIPCQNVCALKKLNAPVFPIIERAISFGANIVTVLLGAVAVYGLYANRNTLPALFHYLQFSTLSERARRLRGTLGQLEGLNYSTKEDKRQILALLGKLAGELIPLESHHSSVAQIQSEIAEILAKKTVLSEPVKCRIVATIHSAVDSSMGETFNKLPNHKP